jgi:hypothetical protein
MKMTNRFDEAAQLKALTGRRDAIIEREQNPCSPNYAILERIKIERDLLEAARWLTEVARCFQRGDADEIAYARDVLASDSRYTGDPRVWTRLLRAAKIMEERE